jgi:hypothetical protein
MRGACDALRPCGNIPQVGLGGEMTLRISAIVASGFGAHFYLYRASDGMCASSTR